MCVKGSLLALLLLLSTPSVFNSSCHDTHKDYFKYLATKTGYRFIQNENDEPLTIPDCKLTKIWGLVRHGTRLPGDSIIDKMRNYLPTLQKQIVDNFLSDKSQLCDISKMKAWTPQVSLKDEEKSLTKEGQRELFALAQRLKNRFPTLLGQEFRNETFFFKYTKTQRTQASAFHFAEGLFGRERSTEVWYPRSQKRDPVLRFYKACEKWRETVDHNPESYEERKAFEQSEHFQHLVARINQRLGFSGNLTVADVILMYTACGFESAWTPGFDPPWCSLFSRQDLELLEYNEDLDYYWVDGHGHPLTGDIACVAFQDMMEQIREDLDYYWVDGHGHPLTGDIACVAFQDMMEQIRSGPDHKDVVFYFTHSGTLLKFLTFLNVFHDSSPLRHSNFQAMRDRKWRVSRIDAFATNVVFASFTCKDNQTYVLALHQERPIVLPGCPSIICPLSTLLNTFGRRLESCDFERMCLFEGENRKGKSLREENTDHDEL